MKKTIITTTIISVIVSVLVLLCGNFIVNKINNKEIATVNFNDDYKIVAGVVRNSGDGWTLIQDDSHETIGIRTVEQDDEKIIINYDLNSKVNALSCTVDETMASEGYTVGASVGLDKTYIFIYDKNNNLVSPKDYINASGNIWIEGVFKR